ncbi:hypothetical protein ABPG73_022084 [Tetrahymena malaccensis]
MSKSQFQVQQLSELDSFDKDETISLSINLNSNKIEEQGAAQIGKALQKLKNLNNLTLVLLSVLTLIQEDKIVIYFQQKKWKQFERKRWFRTWKRINFLLQPYFSNNQVKVKKLFIKFSLLPIFYSNSSLNYDGVKGLCQGISKCYNLNNLGLNLMLFKLQNLNFIKIHQNIKSGNQIRDGIELLGLTFSQLEQLEHLQLECEQFINLKKSKIVFIFQIVAIVQMRKAVQFSVIE